MKLSEVKIGQCVIWGEFKATVLGITERNCVKIKVDDPLNIWKFTDSTTDVTSKFLKVDIHEERKRKIKDFTHED